MFLRREAVVMQAQPAPVVLTIQTEFTGTNCIRMQALVTPSCVIVLGSAGRNKLWCHLFWRNPPSHSYLEQRQSGRGKSHGRIGSTSCELELSGALSSMRDSLRSGSRRIVLIGDALCDWQKIGAC